MSPVPYNPEDKLVQDPSYASALDHTVLVVIALAMMVLFIRRLSFLKWQPQADGQLIIYGGILLMYPMSLVPHLL